MDVDRRTEAVVEVKWRDEDDWVRTYLVCTIDAHFSPLPCPHENPSSDQFSVGPEYDGSGITIGYLGGNEKLVYDVRINGGLSAREQFDSGQCDG